MSLKISDLETGVGELRLSVRALDVESGKVACVMGKSGSGKSTLLGAIAGFVPATGTIEVSGRRVDGLAPEKRGTAMIFQSLSLFPNMSVAGNVEFALKVRGVPRAERRRRALEWLERLGIAPLADRASTAISGGEAQRVAFARALIAGTPVLLLDEPFGALDDENRANLRAVLKDLVRETGVAALLVTHDRADVEALADRLYRLEWGQVVEAKL